MDQELNQVESDKEERLSNNFEDVEEVKDKEEKKEST